MESVGIDGFGEVDLALLEVAFGGLYGFDHGLFVLGIGRPFVDDDGPLHFAVGADGGGPLLAGLGLIVGGQTLRVKIGEGVFDLPAGVPGGLADESQALVGIAHDRLGEDEGFARAYELGLKALLQALGEEVGEPGGIVGAADDLASLAFELAYLLGEVLGRNRIVLGHHQGVSLHGKHLGSGRGVHPALGIGVVLEEHAHLLVGGNA